MQNRHRRTMVGIHLSRTRLVPVLFVSGTLILAGCGTSNSSSPSTSASSADGPAAVSSTSTEGSTTASAPSGLSYSVTNLNISSDGFTFAFTANVNVGTPSTNTEGQVPPYVNVAAAVSGTATLTDTTAGYTADAGHIPLIGLYAAYPANSPVCADSQFGFHPGPTDICAIDVAEFAATCSGAVQSLTNGQRATLVPFAQTAGPLNALQPEPVDGCSTGNDRQPSTTVTWKRLTSDDAQHLIGELAQPPRYWALLNEGSPSQSGTDPAVGNGPACQSDEFYVQGGQYIGQVIASQPSGLTGCVGSG